MWHVVIVILNSPKVDLSFYNRLIHCYCKKNNNNILNLSFILYTSCILLHKVSVCSLEFIKDFIKKLSRRIHVFFFLYVHLFLCGSSGNEYECTFVVFCEILSQIRLNAPCYSACICIPIVTKAKFIPPFIWIIYAKRHANNFIV